VVRKKIKTDTICYECQFIIDAPLRKCSCGNKKQKRDNYCSECTCTCGKRKNKPNGICRCGNTMCEHVVKCDECLIRVTWGKYKKYTNNIQCIVYNDDKKKGFGYYNFLVDKDIIGNNLFKYITRRKLYEGI
jgi:hypothetical protein